MVQPDYLICLECESPVYEFEWEDERPVDIICPACGNEDVDQFLSEEQLDELAAESTPR